MFGFKRHDTTRRITVNTKSRFPNSSAGMAWTLMMAGCLVVAAPAHAFAQDGVFVDCFVCLPVESNRAVRADVGDVDGDGDLDVIVAHGVHTAGFVPFGDFLLQINNGAGVFTNEAASRLPASAFGTQVGSGAILGDVDGDGDLDVFVTNGSSGGLFPSSFSGFQNRLWINNGAGVFVDETGTRLPAATSSSFHAAFGDVDGDGDLDIFVGNVGHTGTGQQNRLLINNGAGVFSDETATRLPTLADITLSVALDDLDGDTDLDIVVNNTSGRQSKVLINDGAGVFTDETATRLSMFGFSQDIKVADVNGDACVDLLFTNNSGRPRIFINSGSGVFTEETATRIPDTFSNSHGLALADVDNDSDIDVFVTTPGSGGRLLLNDGAGFFTDATVINLPGFGGIARYPTFGDLDNDGDADLYIPMWHRRLTDHQDQLLINNPGPIDPLILGEEGDLYVTSYANDIVVQYDGTTGAVVGVFASDAALDGPAGLLFNSNGNLLVAGCDSNNVLEFDGTTGALLRTFASGGGMNCPVGLVFAPNGNLLVVNFYGDNVLEFDGTDGAFIGIFAADGLVGPEFVVIGPNGNLFVDSWFNDSVVEFDIDTGERIGTFASPELDGPFGIVFRPNGNLIVSSFNTQNLLEYDGNTRAFVGVFGTAGPTSGPGDLKFGPNGNLFNADWLTHTVQEFDGATGALIGVFASRGITKANFLVFKPPVDSDGDGLFDATEIELAEGGSCPDRFNPDSDGDTLLDGVEVAAGTNPCNADTDGDGLTDDVDPLPNTPGATSGFLEDESRDLAAEIKLLDLARFNGPNNNANKGRRNALANRATDAANLIAAGEIQGAIDKLTTLLEKIDGQSPPPDWMDESAEKTALADEVAFLILLLEFLL